MRFLWGGEAKNAGPGVTHRAECYVAVDGTEWRYYDFRLAAAAERRVGVPVGSEMATHRAFKSSDGPVYCHRFSAAFDDRDSEPRTLVRQIRDAMAVREAGKETPSISNP